MGGHGPRVGTSRESFVDTAEALLALAIQGPSGDSPSIEPGPVVSLASLPCDRPRMPRGGTRVRAPGPCHESWRAAGRDLRHSGNRQRRDSRVWQPYPTGLVGSRTRCRRRVARGRPLGHSAPGRRPHRARSDSLWSGTVESLQAALMAAPSGLTCGTIDPAPIADQGMSLG